MKHVKITLKYIAHQIKDRNGLCKNNIAYTYYCIMIGYFNKENLRWSYAF